MRHPPAIGPGLAAVPAATLPAGWFAAFLRGIAIPTRHGSPAGALSELLIGAVLILVPAHIRVMTRWRAHVIEKGGRGIVVAFLLVPETAVTARRTYPRHPPPRHQSRHR